jgi:iron(III) transport system substrate-binding protein
LSPDSQKSTPFSRSKCYLDGEKLRQEILTEASAGQFFSDVASVSSMEMGLLKSKNLLQPYDPPESCSYPAATKDKEKFFTAIYARNFVMGYNTAMISEKDRPKDWPDLLDPKWKGRFGMEKKNSSGTAP